VAQTLGFRRIESADVCVDGQTYYTVFLDFGSGSVDGWLAALVGAELGVVQQEFLDVEARELVVGRERVRLTKLEFSVMEYLQEREGKAVDRTSLIEDVWGYKYDVGSNVVDAVVKSLRKKLADHAHMIETVPGFGYRFRRSA
jgi:DNA-binding response OmpR family regulator